MFHHFHNVPTHRFLLNSMYKQQLTNDINAMNYRPEVYVLDIQHGENEI